MGPLKSQQCWLALAGLLVLQGCAAELRNNPVPQQLADQVQVQGFDNVRVWGDAPIKNIDKLMAIRLSQIKQTRPDYLKNRRRTNHMLAISGGGSDGAFGAGFLNGWTATGLRPQFEFVSGVSTGALIAPFAFLGPEYDPQLREIFTRYSTKDILQKQVLAGLTGGSSVTSTKPLERLIAHYVDRKFLAHVAREHKRGRRLLIGTTNLDQDRPVVWNMGKIAVRESDEALRLFRRILLASAALPGVFPPVFIKVMSDTKTYQEMHVDGGTTENAFLLPRQANLNSRKRKSGKFQIYVIANLKMAPDPKVVQATTFGIAGRSLTTLIRQQTEGDLLKIYLRAKENKIDFNLASIPLSFSHKSNETFDTKYMRALYSEGFERARSGYRWQKRPPGL